MTRRLVLLFAGWFTTTAALDLISTWVGVVRMGYTEKNPYTDLSSVEGAVIPEIITLSIGMAMVALGAELKKTLLHDASRADFKTFRKTVFVRKQFLSILIALPMLLAVVRMVVVLSNTLIIFTGYSLFVDEEFSHLSWDRLVMMIYALILVRPTYYVIYRSCRASTRQSPNGRPSYHS